MTSLHELLAYNIKENRRKLGISQKKLAEKAGLSMSYLANVEICSKFPSPQTLEKLAKALEIDTLELFSMPSSVEGVANKLCRDILADLEQKVGKKVSSLINTAVQEVVADHLKELDKQEKAKKKK